VFNFPKPLLPAFQLQCQLGQPPPQQLRDLTSFRSHSLRFVQSRLRKTRARKPSETYTNPTSTGTSINGPTTPARACPDVAP
jgi:hypothetical protein